MILATSLRLDEIEDQARLADAVDCFRPVVLVLDPFVRLGRIDELCAAVLLVKTIQTRAPGRQSLVMLRDRGRSTVGVATRKGSGMVVTSVGLLQECSP